MILAKIDNGIITQIDEHTAMFPNVSFGINGVTEEFCLENSVLPVIDRLPYDTETQNLIAVDPYLEDHKIYRVRVENKTQEELYAIHQAKLSQQVVSMRQARLALLQFGLLDAVNQIVETSDEAVKISWEFSTQVERMNPLVQTIATSLEWTEEQLTELFVTAAGL